MVEVDIFTCANLMKMSPKETREIVEKRRKIKKKSNILNLLLPWQCSSEGNK